MVSFRATRDEHLEYAEKLGKLPEADVAWFGGWLCADGSIKGQKEYVPTIKFSITDKDPLDKMSDMFDNKVSGPYAQGVNALGTKPIYEWGIRGWKAKAILVRVRPWLSDRYAKRAEAFESWQPRGHAGRKLTPADVLDIKARLAVGTHGIGTLLADEYNVTKGMISSIKAGRTWEWGEAA